jgi:U3 small nucleolar RNA-associated protein 12
MVNSYNKYGLSQTFGLVNSALSNVLSLSSSAVPGQAVVGANEHVLVWDVKKGELLHKWADPSSDAQVTAIANGLADGDILAVGYASLPFIDPTHEGQT